jgi:small subunit ribosomal protein S16
VAVKLRLMRMGKKKQPTYRIVAADSRSPRDGRFIEVVGTYAPRSEPSAVSVDKDKALAWLTKGAQPTETVRKLLVISGAWDEFAATRPAKPARARDRSKKAPAKKAPAKKAPAKASVAAAKKAAATATAAPTGAATAPASE